MSGAVILARHGEPALSRDIRLTANGYREWWARYEQGGLKPDQTPPQGLVEMARSAGILLASTRERARQSAIAVADGRVFDCDPLFVEAPLPPPALPTWMRFSPKVWGGVSRFWWQVFDHHQGEESHAQARQRAAAAATALIARAENGEDVLLIAHGYFNYMIGRALSARGWRRTLNEGFRYWSARRFEKGESP